MSLFRVLVVVVVVSCLLSCGLPVCAGQVVWSCDLDEVTLLVDTGQEQSRVPTVSLGTESAWYHVLGWISRNGESEILELLFP